MPEIRVFQESEFKWKGLNTLQGAGRLTQLSHDEMQKLDQSLDSAALVRGRSAGCIFLLQR